MNTVVFGGEEFHVFSQTRLQQRRERCGARFPNTESGKRLWFATTSGSQCEMNKFGVKCRACLRLSREGQVQDSSSFCAAISNTRFSSQACHVTASEWLLQDQAPSLP